MNGQTVYVDLTLITNLGADFLLLYFTAILSGSQVRWWRLLVAAGTGAVFALFFILYPDSLWLSPVSRILFAFIMVYIAFAPFRGRALWRTIGFFYLLTFLVGGAAYAIANLGWASFSYRTLPGALLAACVLTVVAHRWLTQKTLVTKQFCALEITLGEQTLKGTGIVDTGNSLSDPLSGKPVVIADHSWIKKILPPEFNELMVSGDWNSVHGAEVLVNSNQACRYRLLSYQSLGQANGLMLALTCDQVKVIIGGQVRIHKQMLIALAGEGMSQEASFQALVPAALI